MLRLILVNIVHWFGGVVISWVVSKKGAVGRGCAWCWKS